MKKQNCECITKQDIKDVLEWIVFIVGFIIFVSVLIFPSYYLGKSIGFDEGKVYQRDYYEAFYNCEHK